MTELAREQPLELSLDRQIAEVFDRCFIAEYGTQLCGGAAEPLYVPARQPGEVSQVHYREDFARSALHEAAHWCIAGEARRQLEDYGYWYEPDGRSDAKQREFERVESRPQALEWFFAQAVGLPFGVSIDNLAAGDINEFPFALAVWQQARRYVVDGLPDRAGRFRLALANTFGTSPVIDAQAFSLASLCRR